MADIISDSAKARSSPLLPKAFWAAFAFMAISRSALILGLDLEQFADCKWYFDRAIEMLSTHRYAENGISTAYWPVGYPAFMAGVMALFGASSHSAQFANLALSLGCMTLLFLWCRIWSRDIGTAVLAVWLLALYPNHMGYSVGLYSEPLFTLLLLAFVVIGARNPDTLWKIVAMGFLAGLATLVKTQMLLLAPAMMALLFLRTWSLSACLPALRATAIGTICMIVTVMPWTFRNLLVLGVAVPVSTNGGMSLLAGNNPAMTTELDHDYNDRHPIVEAVRFSVADQVAADERARQFALAWIVENPGRFALLMPKKLFRFWVPDGESEWTFQAGYKNYAEYKNWFRGVRWLNQLYYFGLLIFASVAIFKLRIWRLPRTSSPLLLFCYFSILSMVFSGQSRYHAPLMPFIIGLAAWAGFSSSRLIAQKMHQPAPTRNRTELAARNAEDSHMVKSLPHS